MGALKIVGVILAILFLLMLSLMVITERDKPKNMILWALCFFFLSVVGFTVYGVSKLILYKKRKSLDKKQWEDEVYINLISNNLVKTRVNTNEDFYNFNFRAYKSSLTYHNKCEIINSYVEFKSELCASLNKAEKLIIFEIVKVNKLDFEPIKQILINKAKAGVVVKFVYDSFISPKLKIELKRAGVKVYKFSKYKTLGRIYENTRNLISIDNKVAYLGDIGILSKQLKQELDTMDAFIKFEGEVVQDIDVLMQQDVLFASGKFLDFEKHDLVTTGNTKIQFVSNSINEDLELLIVKAITMAKKSISLQLNEFIPTESIMSLLRFAINSHIEVKLMVPLKTATPATYYATRAYAKELALAGAKVYLYDGFIRFNAIVIDERIVLVGSYSINRQHINTSLQNLAVIEDFAVVSEFLRLFDMGVDNSYKINDARYMLLRERFFKNFV